MLRVGIDATPLTSLTGGVPRYVRELHRALRELNTNDEFCFFTDQPLEGAIGPRAGWLEKKWWLAGLPMALRRERIDVFHGTEYSVPYVPVCASVLSLHDLSPWLEPSWHSAGVERVRSRTPWLLRLGLPTMVLTLSEAVRRQAIARFGLRPERVAAVPLAAASTFRPVAAPGGGRYFLHTGTLEPRKNLPMLVEAWRPVWRAQRVRLVLAGRRREDGPKFEAEDGLDLLGPVDEERLPELYSGALAVVYPSYHEGFRLPVVEAMRCGAPVITSTDASVMEVAGGAALHCDARDGRAWTEAMMTLAGDSSRAAGLRGAGLERASVFHWERTARETLEVYRKAAKLRG